MSAYKNFTIETDADGIALVTWDMPDKSMNVFTVEVMDELERIIDQVVADAAIKGAVITSGKSSFSGGADLSMIKASFDLLKDAEATDPATAVQKLFDDRVQYAKPADYLIRVNRQPAPADQVLQEGDRVSFTPTKIEGAK